MITLYKAFVVFLFCVWGAPPPPPFFRIFFDCTQPFLYFFFVWGGVPPPAPPFFPRKIPGNAVANGIVTEKSQMTRLQKKSRTFRLMCFHI